MTDDDQPHAAIFRLPNERLLDNTIHLRNRTTALEAVNLGSRLTAVEGRATALEGRATNPETRATALEDRNSVSSITALSALSNTTARVIASRQVSANEAVAGTSFRYAAQLRAARGATATVFNVDLAIRVGGVTIHQILAALNTTNGFIGGARIQGEITFHSAPSGSASFTATCLAHECLISSGTSPTITLKEVDLTTVQATSGPFPFAIEITARQLATVAGVAITPVSASIAKVTP
jgi:hypothetical protein